MEGAALSSHKSVSVKAGKACSKTPSAHETSELGGQSRMTAGGDHLMVVDQRHLSRRSLLQRSHSCPSGMLSLFEITSGAADGGRPP